MRRLPACLPASRRVIHVAITTYRAIAAFIVRNFRPPLNSSLTSSSSSSSSSMVGSESAAAAAARRTNAMPVPYDTEAERARAYKVSGGMSRLLCRRHSFNVVISVSHSVCTAKATTGADSRLKFDGCALSLAPQRKTRKME